MGDHDLDHHVGELDVHDGSHRLLLRPEQGGSEADAQVGDGHEVLVRLLDHVGEVGEQDLEHPLVGGGQLLHKPVDLPQRDLQICHKEVYESRHRKSSKKFASEFYKYLGEASAVAVALCSLNEPRVQRESHDRL